VVGAQTALVDRQRALVQGARAVHVALVAQDEGEVVEAVGGCLLPSGPGGRLEERSPAAARGGNRTAGGQDGQAW